MFVNPPGGVCGKWDNEQRAADWPEVYPHR